MAPVEFEELSGKSGSPRSFENGIFRSEAGDRVRLQQVAAAGDGRHFKAQLVLLPVDEDGRGRAGGEAGARRGSAQPTQKAEDGTLRRSVRPSAGQAEDGTLRRPSAGQGNTEAEDINPRHSVRPSMAQDQPARRSQLGDAEPEEESSRRSVRPSTAQDQPARHSQRGDAEPEEGSSRRSLRPFAAQDQQARRSQLGDAEPEEGISRRSVRPSAVQDQPPRRSQLGDAEVEDGSLRRSVRPSVAQDQPPRRSQLGDAEVEDGSSRRSMRPSVAHEDQPPRHSHLGDAEAEEGSSRRSVRPSLAQDQPPRRSQLGDAEVEDGSSRRSVRPSVAQDGSARRSTRPSVEQGQLLVKDGDFLEATEDYLVHACDCISTGKAEGLAAKVFGRFPGANVQLERARRQTRDVPGDVSVHGRVVNLYAQFSPDPPMRACGVRPRPEVEQHFAALPTNRWDIAEDRLDWFCQCLDALPGRLPAEGPEGRRISLAMPVGVGCAGGEGGRWPEYLDAIREFARANAQQFRVVMYDGQNEDVEEQAAGRRSVRGSRRSSGREAEA